MLNVQPGDMVFASGPDVFRLDFGKPAAAGRASAPSSPARLGHPRSGRRNGVADGGGTGKRHAQVIARRADQPPGIELFPPGETMRERNPSGNLFPASSPKSLR